MTSKEKGNPSAGPKGAALKRHDSSFGLTVKSTDQKLNTQRTNRNSNVKKTPTNQQAKSNGGTSKSIIKSSFDEQAAEEQFNKMLEGYLDNIPNIPRLTVRIFMSSTFSDMRAERNTIAREVTPKLKEFCAQHELDFQMVDMRWGVTDDNQNDHSVEKICLAEVENCQKVSLGPNFVLLKGSRYGFRPIPTEMSTDDFKLLTSYINNPYHLKLLNTWYQKDDNNLPPHYVLQPIRSQFTFFGDYSPSCDEPRAKDTKGWHQTYTELQNILRQAATAAASAGKMSAQKLHEYFMSVTETEIDKGILSVKNPIGHGGVYIRSLSSLDQKSLEDKQASRYVEIKDNNGKLEIDPEIEKLREELSIKIVKKMKNNNCHHYTVPWITGGISPCSNDDHARYIQTFCRDFMVDIMNQIKDAMTDFLPSIRFNEYYTDYQELIHHLQFCHAKCETFCGLTDVLDCVQKYILQDTSRKPLVLHAPSGGGKTSVMAKIMKNLPVWFKKKKYVGVIRFLGTSPLSTNIYDILFSVCGQLADNADIIMEPIFYKNIKSLIDNMPRFLRRVANVIKAPIVILLDSLDQLSSHHDAYSLSWLPTVLPPSMKLVVSTLPEEHGILDNMKELLPADQCYVPILPLPVTTAKEIASKYLGLKKRIVNDRQLQCLMSAFHKAPGPLFLKLLLDQAVTWNSYMPEHELVLTDSVRSAISKLFENLEKKFGQVITSHALGYITVALNGVSETEIGDVLSCDDEALNDVYRYHDPPVQGIIRMPPVLWARIRYDLKEYLVERRSHNKYTLNWYHRQFIETARSKYTMGKRGQKLHSNFAEIFMSKPVKRTIELTWRKTTIENADRQTTVQAVTSKNKRLLDCLPYYLNHAGDFVSSDMAKQSCFCNLHFLASKVAAFPLSTLLEDLRTFVEKSEDGEVQKLQNFFSICKLEDLSNTSRLAVSLLARISLSEEDKNLASMLDEARTSLNSQTKTLLIPKFACLAPQRDTSNAMKDSLTGYDSILAVSLESVLLYKGREKTNDESLYSHAVYNNTTEEMKQVGLPEKFDEGLLPHLGQMGKNIFFITEKAINILKLSTEKTTVKGLVDICPELPSTAESAMSAFNTESSHVAILFQDSNLVLIDLNTLNQVSLTGLSKDSSDVINLVCTGSHLLNIIVTGRSGEVDNGKPTEGFVQLISSSHGDKDLVRNLPSVFSRGLVHLGPSEQYVIGMCNTDTESTLMAVELEDELEIRCQMYIPDPAIQISVAKEKSFAAILTKKGVVSIVDWKDGEVKAELATNNPVSCLFVNWSNRLAVLGDSQGQIVLYNVKTYTFCGVFPAHPNTVKELVGIEGHVLSTGKNKEMKVWSLSALADDIKRTRAQTSGREIAIGLLGQTEVASLDLTLDSKEIITASRDKNVYIWSLEDTLIKRQFSISMVADKMQVISSKNCVGLDTSSRKMKMFNLKDGDDIMELPKGALDFTVSQDKSLLCVLCQKDKGIMVDVVDLKVCKSKKTFYLKGEFHYITIDINLSANNRYLLLRIKITPEEFKEIEASWKKQGSFLPQNHQYRFSAVDLTQATGGMMPCLRLTSKIPHLGEVMHPFHGNVVLVTTTRRWVLFWDIPTGKCDQKMCRTEKKGMLYRPDWLGQDCRGTNIAIVQSSNLVYLAVGSEDGYVFIYNSESSLPVEKKVPSSKHSAAVILVSFSPDNDWVVSACRNNTVKIWEASTGKEVFSTRLNSEIISMHFSLDSKSLVICIGSQVTRILVYKFHTGY